MRNRDSLMIRWRAGFAIERDTGRDVLLPRRRRGETMRDVLLILVLAVCMPLARIFSALTGKPVHWH